MQPYLFPYIGYFQLFNAVNEFVIYDDIQYIKGGWINRNNILIGGQKTLFTIALHDASPNKMINEIEIKDDFIKLLKTINMAYSKAPYKNEVMQLLNEICSFEDKNLARFIGNSIICIANYIGLEETKVVYSSDLNKNSSLKAQDKVINICKNLEATTYINAIGGRELYDKETFKKNGIELQFIKPQAREYKQFKKEYVPALSIIDVMMFNSPIEIREMLNDYEII